MAAFIPLVKSVMWRLTPSRVPVEDGALSSMLETQSVIADRLPRSTTPVYLPSFSNGGGHEAKSWSACNRFIDCRSTRRWLTAPIGGATTRRAGNTDAGSWLDGAGFHCVGSNPLRPAPRFRSAF